MALVLAVSPTSRAHASEPVAVPSGLSVAYHDVILDAQDAGATYRFRFVAPQIAEGGADYQAVAADMDFLCNEFAMTRLDETGPQAARIVITLMAQPVEFGVMTPGVTQFFESFSIKNDLCIWEPF
ncbi:DUF6497 family protein [Tropicibacter oceani]|uniref:DUF6497 family protein n=1 Tax=Tropicibacter oceani TaxID=3058420 RepID=A0ABY8QMG5_9RHOB|nr:DUF6497 family protein [Tropicibacter oceani]WGW05824.1 DUF6497 family protein [Tropicibacter oceani]